MDYQEGQERPLKRRRLGFELRIPSAAKQVTQTTREKRQRGKLIEITRTAFSIRSYPVKTQAGPKLGVVDKDLFELVNEGWLKFPKTQWGVSTTELQEHIPHTTRYLREAADKLGYGSNGYRLFPKINLRSCPREVRDREKREARLVPIWLLLFFLKYCVAHQFSKINSRFVVVYDLLKKIQSTMVIECDDTWQNICSLMEKAMAIDTRISDEECTAYRITFESLNSEVTALKREVETLKAQIQTLLQHAALKPANTFVGQIFVPDPSDEAASV